MIRIFGETSGAPNQIVFSDNKDGTITYYPVNIYWWSDKKNITPESVSELSQKILDKTTKIGLKEATPEMLSAQNIEIKNLKKN